MRTNEKNRKTMEESWIWFFNEIQKKYKFKKYFNDGDFRTCAYNSERMDHNIVECAPRRQKGASVYLLGQDRQNRYEKIFGSKDLKVNEFYVTTSYRYGGVWVYNQKILNHTPTKPRNGRPYFRINIKECHKVCDLWEVFDFCTLEEIYHIARNQYEYMMKPDEKTGIAPFEKVKTWRDLPDYCLWKYQFLDGSVIPGREKEFEEYKRHTKNLDGYIPCHDFSR